MTPELSSIVNKDLGGKYVQNTYHRKQARPSMLCHKIFIIKFTSINALTSTAIALKFFDILG
jgi:hypothetical protein